MRRVAVLHKPRALLCSTSAAVASASTFSAMPAHPQRTYSSTGPSGHLSGAQPDRSTIPPLLASATAVRPMSLSRMRYYGGSGASSPALFRPTRLARIPPQLLRLLTAGGVALVQVFVVAFQRESRRLREEETATDSMHGTGTTTTSRRQMTGVEAIQILGLDRAFATLFTEVQKAEAGAAQAGCSAALPLVDGKAREVAKRNFDRMFALAVREENMFLAGKLSAAYRVCVDPQWDEPREELEGTSSKPASKTEQGPS